VEQSAVNYNIVSSQNYLCGESPVWMSKTKTLCWTDIDGKTLHKKHMQSKKILNFKMSGKVSCIAPNTSGGFIAAMDHSILNLDSEFNILSTVTTIKNGNSSWRLNDGKADRSGNFFWVGSIYLPRDKKHAALWRLSSDGKMKKILRGLTTSNGLAWSPDGSTMYLSDSWESTIWKYDYNQKTGDISNKRMFFTTNKNQGRPDGACVDSLGHYWFAGFDGGRILRISPEGELNKEILVPMKRPTMPAFGGSKMNTLFITSFGGISNPTLSKANALMDGNIISLQLDVRGFEETPFNYNP
jgi:sugar lactone lactonase YvrE